MHAVPIFFSYFTKYAGHHFEGYLKIKHIRTQLFMATEDVQESRCISKIVLFCYLQQHRNETSTVLESVKLEGVLFFFFLFFHFFGALPMLK